MTKTIAKQAMNGKNGKRAVVRSKVASGEIEAAVYPETARKIKRLCQIIGADETELVDMALNMLVTHVKATSTLCIDPNEGEEPVEVRFTLTADQYRAVKAACDDYRLDIGELAKDGVFTILEGHADSDGGYDWILETVQQANTDRATGQHPRFMSWQASLVKGA
jgi:hypothetical protein